MYWYNPAKRIMESVSAPLVDAQAIEMLSGHPNSGEFIEEYRRKRVTKGVEEAMILTGEFFYRDRGRGQSLG
jgi:hypothetical protein